MAREQEVVTMGEREVVTGENFNPLAKKRIADLEAQLAALNESLRATSDALMEAQAQLAACREALEDAIPFLDCYPLMGKPLADKARAALKTIGGL